MRSRPSDRSCEDKQTGLFHRDTGSVSVRCLHWAPPGQPAQSRVSGCYSLARLGNKRPLSLQGKERLPGGARWNQTLGRRGEWEDGAQGLDRQQLPGKGKGKGRKKEDGARQPEHKDGLCWLEGRRKWVCGLCPEETKKIEGGARGQREICRRRPPAAGWLWTPGRPEPRAGLSEWMSFLRSKFAVCGWTTSFWAGRQVNPIMPALWEPFSDGHSQRSGSHHVGLLCVSLLVFSFGGLISQVQVLKVGVSTGGFKLLPNQGEAWVLSPLLSEALCSRWSLWWQLCSSLFYVLWSGPSLVW